jgi:hypothetical protein
VTVTVTTGPPVTVLGPIALNRQNGLFEQFARVSNSTPNDLLGGVRIFAHLPTNDTTNVVWNATGKTNGIPFIDSLTPLLAGGYVDVLIQYYVPNPRSVPTVTLTAEPIPFTPPPVPRPRVVSVSQNGNATTIEFTTVRNCLYYLQSSEDLVHWITVSGLMHGTGERMQCTDSPGRSRQFYRTIAIR